MPRLFTPTARQLNVVIAAGLIALGYALYLRYMAIEASSVGLACQSGLRTWLCWTRTLVIAAFEHWGFGVTALGAALYHWVRPSIVPFTVALVAADFGIVLYNVGLSSLAVGLLILSLARPASAAA